MLRQESLNGDTRPSNPAAASDDGTGLFCWSSRPPKTLFTIMNNRTLFCSLLFAAGTLLAVPVALAAAGHKPADPAKAAPADKPGKLSPLSEKDAEWAAAARKDYPLKTCLTSDEALGSMGESPEYIYRVEGKPDQLVVFCCDGCNEDFLKDPAPYLAKLAAAKDAQAKAGSKKEDAHKGHP